MAGAVPGVHVLNLEPNQVPVALIAGEKVFKWDEELNSSVPCLLKVDAKAFYLYWIPSIVTTGPPREFLEISVIRDTRTGRYSRPPKFVEAGPVSHPPLHCTSSSNSGSGSTPGDTLEDRTLTICTATDFVNLTWTTFVFDSSNKAKLWSEELLKYSRNTLSNNGSAVSYLEKIHARITITLLNAKNEIPVNSIIQLFASHRDKRKVQTALVETIGHEYLTQSTILPTDFTFQKFFSFYLSLCRRDELNEIFHKLGLKDGKGREMTMTSTQFMKFLNEHQRDPRLNEILYPFFSEKDTQKLIEKYEPLQENSKNGLLSFDGLLMYLLSHENLVISLDRYDHSDDMSQPLSHYFINSSHNTYLTGHQMRSQSSVEIYRQVLLSGCRCIELDCWPGDRNEPVITHGFTVCTQIPFKDVIEAIAESAFKTSDYPVILSFENHVNSPIQQEKMASYCRTIFGDLLLHEPLPDYPLEPGVKLPSPAALKRKIIIKNNKGRRSHSHHNHVTPNIASATSAAVLSSTSVLAASDGEVASQTDMLPEGNSSNSSDEVVGPENNNRTNNEIPKKRLLTHGDNGEIHYITESALDLMNKQLSYLYGSDASKEINGRRSSHTASEVYESDTSSIAKSKKDDELDGSGLDDESTNHMTDSAISHDDKDGDYSGSESEVDDDDQTAALTEAEILEQKKEEGTEAREVSCKEMASLVNYCTPVSFHSFEHSKKKNRSYELSSFVETHALHRLNKEPVELINYNKRQLSRIYPKGTRVDSSNFMPQVFWNAGCQLVALNFQTLDVPMQLNQGIYELNGYTGYLLKPLVMRRQKKFDPFAESTVDGVVAGYLSIRIISGCFLTDKKAGIYVEVEMYGLPADTVRKKFKTRVISNSINPLFEENPFVFKKVVLPDLAILRVAVFEEKGKLIGHRFLPVTSIRPGFRHISLRNELGQPLVMPSLFVHIIVKDFVPDDMEMWANALANPIAYQNNLEKHKQQLKVLTDGFDVDDDLVENSSTSVMSDEDKASNTLRFKKKPRYHQSEDNLDQVGDHEAVPLSAMSHAISMPHILESRDNYPKTASVQNIGLAAISLPAIASSAADDSALTSQQSEDIQNKFFSDEVCGAPSFAVIKASKYYVKVEAKEAHELKKHEKRFKKNQMEFVCPHAVRQHQRSLSFKKLLTRTNTRTCHIQKLVHQHNKELKKAQKRQQKSLRVAAQNGSFKEVKRSNTQELAQVRSNHDQQLKDAELEHIRLHLDVYKEFYTEELIIKQRFDQPLREAATKALNKLKMEQLKKIDRLHKKQIVVLRNLMEDKRQNKMKKLQMTHKDKHELARMKREIQTKHVNKVVQHLEWLHEHVVTNSKQKLEASYEALVERLSEVVDRDEELMEREKLQKINLKEQELMAAVRGWNVKGKTEDVTNGSANGNCNNSASNGASQAPKFDPIIEEESEDTHL